MSVYLKETADFTFSMTNDKGLLIRDRKKQPYTPIENFDGTSPGFTFYKEAVSIDPVAKRTRAIKIHNFLDGMKSHAAGLVVQTVLTAFAHLFEKNGDQREQLIEGMQYFFFSNHYNVLYTDSDRALKELRKTYDKIISNNENYNKEYNDLIERARVLHMQQPFIASTGLVVYATRDATWMVYETLVQADDAPEYLYSIDIRDKDGLRADVYTGKQKMCIKWVMDNQKTLYGINFDEVTKKQIEKTTIDKTRKELEVVLQIPTKERHEYMDEQHRHRVEQEAALDANLTQLDKYDTLRKS